MKKIFILMIALMMSFTVNAQIATENAKLLDNIYVGVEAGAATPLDFNSVFPLNTIAGLKLGKELTPIFGVEVEGQVFFNENNFQRWTDTFVKGTYFTFAGTINLNNLFFGYNGAPRTFEVKTNTGLSWLNRWKSGGDNALGAKTGLDFTFNLGKKKASSFVVSPGVYWVLGDNGSKIAFDKRRAQLALTASYVYHFKTSNGTHYFKTYDVGAMIGEIDRLNEELAKKPKEVEVIKYVDRVVNNYTNVTTVKDTYVFFAYDDATLDDRAKAELDKLGENGVYDVVAYASSEGNTEYNKRLSERRAAAVVDYLTKRGCKINSWEGRGVQFGTTTGRVAVVTAK